MARPNDGRSNVFSFSLASAEIRSDTIGVNHGCSQRGSSARGACSRRIAVVVAAVACSLWLLVPSLAADQDHSAGDDPAWVAYEQGRRYHRARDYSAALESYRAAVRRDETLGEAYYRIGRVYEDNADLSEALRYYRRAISDGDFRAPDLEHQVYYRIAQVHWKRGAYYDYEQTMEAFFARDAYFASEEYAEERRNQLELLFDRTISRVLILYRIPMTFSQPAHSEYADYLVRSGRFDDALPHLLQSLAQILTEAIEEYRRDNRRYEFRVLSEFLDRVEEERPDIAEFIEESGFYYDIYRLGDALYFSGRERRGREMWRFITWYDRPPAELEALAASQLASPEQPTPPR